MIVFHGLQAADPAMKWPDRRNTANIGYIGINKTALARCQWHPKQAEN
jgi:hypothetical protein